MECFECIGSSKIVGVPYRRKKTDRREYQPYFQFLVIESTILFPWSDFGDFCPIFYTLKSYKKEV